MKGFEPLRLKSLESKPNMSSNFITSIVVYFLKLINLVTPEGLRSNWIEINCFLTSERWCIVSTMALIIAISKIKPEIIKIKLYFVYKIEPIVLILSTLLFSRNQSFQIKLLLNFVSINSRFVLTEEISCIEIVMNTRKPIGKLCQIFAL